MPASQDLEDLEQELAGLCGEEAVGEEAVGEEAVGEEAVGEEAVGEDHLLLLDNPPNLEVSISLSKQQDPTPPEASMTEQGIQMKKRKRCIVAPMAKDNSKQVVKEEKQPEETAKPTTPSGTCVDAAGSQQQDPSPEPAGEAVDKKKKGAPKMKDCSKQVVKADSQHQDPSPEPAGEAVDKKKKRTTAPKAKKDSSKSEVKQQDPSPEPAGEAVDKKKKRAPKVKDSSKQVVKAGSQQQDSSPEPAAKAVDKKKKRTTAPKAKKDNSKQEVKVDKSVSDAEEAAETEAIPSIKHADKSTSKTRACRDAASVEMEQTNDDDDSDDEWGWEEDNIADYIVCRSMDGNFIVSCKDKTLDLAGQIEGRAAKLQRTTGDDPSCPVTLEMMDEYEKWEKRFKMEFHDRLGGKKDLDLENLPPGSTLEMCSFLGKLQWEQQLLSKGNTKLFGEKDMMIKVPAITLSMVMQNIVNHEREKCTELVKQQRDECSKLKESLAKANAELLSKGIAVIPEP